MTRSSASRQVKIVALAAAAGLILACGGGPALPSPTSAARSAGSEQQTQSSRPARPGQLAPDFTIQVARSSGDRLVPDAYSLSNREGPVVLYFSFVG